MQSMVEKETDCVLHQHVFYFEADKQKHLDNANRLRLGCFED